METLLTMSKLEVVKRRLGFEGCFGVDPVGRSGGIPNSWKGDILFEVYNFSQRHISGWIVEKVKNEKWLLTGFYGHLDANKDIYLGVCC